MTTSPSTKKVDEVFIWIKRQFGDESGVQITDADILRWTNQAQIEIASIVKVIQAVSTGALVSGTYSYDLPIAGAIEIVSINVNGQPVQGLDFQQAQQHIMENDPTRIASGQPKYWWQWANKVYFWPTPNTSSVSGIEIYSVGIPPVLTSGLDTIGIPDKYFEAIIMFCMAKAFELDEDQQAAQAARQQFSDRIGTSYEDDSRGETLFYPSITVVDEW